jgi:glycosyltransferase involved in cell wall biosynthesis
MTQRGTRGSQTESLVASGQAHIAICNWRDLRHPEGGGSELYIEAIAKRLAAAGNQVTLMSAAVDGAPQDEIRDGVHYRRRGTHHSVYPRAALALITRRVRPDVIVDVQNGVPFMSTLVTRRPVVALIHHVHREQWSIVFGPRAARVGWWVESRLGPFLYRKSRYVAVSDATRRDLAELGVEPSRVTVVHNGTPRLSEPRLPRSVPPRVVVLGRLVPHKQVGVVLAAAAALRHRHPDLVVDVVGQGYFEPDLRAQAAELGLGDSVVFHGFVDEETKSDLLAQAWVNAVPSVKEGWALSVVEAATHGTPSIAFAGAGGLGESILANVTGVLVDGGQAEFTEALGALLDDPDRREGFGRAARQRAAMFTWDDAGDEMADVLDAAMGRAAVVCLPVEPAVSHAA